MLIADYSQHKSSSSINIEEVINSLWYFRFWRLLLCLSYPTQPSQSNQFLLLYNLRQVTQSAESGMPGVQVPGTSKHSTWQPCFPPSGLLHHLPGIPECHAKEHLDRCNCSEHLWQRKICRAIARTLKVNTRDRWIQAGTRSTWKQTEAPGLLTRGLSQPGDALFCLQKPEVAYGGF